MIMSRIGTTAIVTAMLFFGLATRGVAQPLSGPLNYNVRTMSFELWRQDTPHYPPERCQARRPEDVAAFESYRRLIERYELDYLKRVQKDQAAERSFINRDPSQTVLDKVDTLPWALSGH
jgi:hypothetical protein